MSDKLRVRLNYWRSRKGFTMQKLSDETGISVTTIYRIENGLKFPHPSTIDKIAKALGIKPEELVVDADEEEKHLVQVS